MVSSAPAILVMCKACGHQHRMVHRPCPSCGVYTTLQPASDAVMDRCGAIQECDGCEAYREHLSPW